MRELPVIERAYATLGRAARSGWNIYEVDWPAYAAFHRAVRQLDQSLREHDLLEQWAVFSSFCKRYRYFLGTHPLPAAELTKQMMGWRTASSPGVASLMKGSPSPVAAACKDVQEVFGELQAEAENPLWRSALDDILCRQHDDSWIGILSTETRLAGAIASFLGAEDAGKAWLWPLRPTDLKSASEIYAQLVVFGPTGRHTREGTDYIFKCPRAEVVTLFTPDVFRASVPSPYDLIGSPHAGGLRGRNSELRTFADPTVMRSGAASAADGEGQAAADGEKEKEWLDALPKLNFTYRQFVDRAGDHGEFAEAVPARQVLLSSDHIVYLASAGSVSRLTIGDGGEPGRRVCDDVHHVDVAELGVEDVVVFSAEGGGDMIVEVANSLLGDDAVRFRSLQTEWKLALNMMVAINDSSETARSLRALGSKLASAGNVRNWCSAWNIGPGTWRSFDAVLRYCGLDGRKDEFFEATKRLRTAHKRAGFQLAGRLREMMKDRYLDELFTTGRQEFGGTAALPNRKVAFLVLEIFPGNVDVSPYDIQRPLEIDSKSWR